MVWFLLQNHPRIGLCQILHSPWELFQYNLGLDASAYKGKMNIAPLHKVLVIVQFMIQSAPIVVLIDVHHTVNLHDFAKEKQRKYIRSDIISYITNPFGIFYVFALEISLSYIYNVLLIGNCEDSQPLSHECFILTY